MKNDFNYFTLGPIAEIACNDAPELCKINYFKQIHFVGISCHKNNNKINGKYVENALKMNS